MPVSNASEQERRGVGDAKIRDRIGPSQKVFKAAFAVSVLTFALALCVIAWLFSLPKDPPGEGGYAILALVMLGVYASSILSFVSFAMAALSAVTIRPARWFLIPATLLAGLGVWALIHAEVKATVDTVGPADVPRLIGLLKTDQGRDWKGDVYLLAHLGAEAAPALIEAMQSDDARTRLGAARALRDMSFRAKPVIPQLTSALRHKDPKVRAMVAEALGMACRDNEDDEIAVPGLCERLQDEEPEVRRQAVGAIGWMETWGTVRMIFRRRPR